MANVIRSGNRILLRGKHEFIYSDIYGWVYAYRNDVEKCVQYFVTGELRDFFGVRRSTARFSNPSDESVQEMLEIALFHRVAVQPPEDNFALPNDRDYTHYFLSITGNGGGFVYTDGYRNRETRRAVGAECWYVAEDNRWYGRFVDRNGEEVGRLIGAFTLAALKSQLVKHAAQLCGRKIGLSWQAVPTLEALTIKTGGSHADVQS